MVHGRARGETFGLAVAEFSAAGKPVSDCLVVIHCCSSTGKRSRGGGGGGVDFHIVDILIVLQQ